MLRPLAATLALTAALAAGCGTTSNGAQDLEGAEADVAEVVEDLERAATEEEPRRVCQQLLTRAFAQQLGGARCPEAMQRAFDATDSFTLAIDSVRVSGQSARARVLSGRDEDRAQLVELTREGDAWRIAAFRDTPQS